VATEADASRPAFYALAPGGWRDYVTLLHAPYTAWHLSYVAIGAAVAPLDEPRRLVLALAAFFLAVGIAAHALDELNGRPLGTRIPSSVLAGLAAASLVGAVAIGIYGAVTVNAWIAAFVAVGAFLAVTYSLELLGGRFHGDVAFALFWGAFPVVTGFFAVAETISEAAVVAAAFAFGLSLAQRRLSTQVRDVRRRVARVSGRIERHDGTSEPVTVDTLIGAEERALRLLAGSAVALAVALVAMRLV
jgi:hypothetical protein